MKFFLLGCVLLVSCSHHKNETWTAYSEKPFIEKFEGSDQRMLGSFEGTLTLEDGCEHIVKMLIQDTALVTVTDEHGEEYLRNNRSDIKRIIKHAGENAYYVEAGPTSFFLISLKHYPQMTGKFFEEGKEVGKVILVKQFPVNG